MAGNACLEFYGAKPMSLQQYRDLFTFPILHFYKKYGLSVDEVLAKKDESNAVFQSTYEDLAKHARTRRGARALLAWLSDTGTSNIILSNYVTEKIKPHVARLGIGDHFQDINAHTCNGTTILEKTSKIDRLQCYMDQHGFAPTDTYIIGDSTEEPEIAHHLGLTSIGITDGYICEKRLRAARPDYIVNRLDDIIPILDREWSNQP